MGNENESSLKIICYIFLFAIIFCISSWIYYHGYYTGYFDAYFSCKKGTIDNNNNERFRLKFERLEKDK